MKVLITGAAGFIGSYITNALIREGHTVTGLDNFDPMVHSGACETHVKYDIEWIHEGVQHWLPQKPLDFEAVVHCAAMGGVGYAKKNPGYLIHANCLGTANLCRVLEKVCPQLQHSILASSFSVYGSSYEHHCLSCGAFNFGCRDPKDMDQGRYEMICSYCSSADMRLLPIKTTALPSPKELYATSKYTQEILWRALPKKQTILRFSSVYGPGMRLNDGEATIIAQLAGSLGRGERPQLFEDGQQIRDWVAVSDIAAVIAKLLDGAQAPAVMNVCAGVPTTLESACLTLAAALGKEIRPEIVGGWRPGDMRHCLGDHTELSVFLERHPQSLTVENARWAFGG